MRGNCCAIFTGVLTLSLIFGGLLFVLAIMEKNITTAGLMAGWIIVGFLIGCVERMAGYEAASCGIPWGIWGFVSGFLMLLARNEVAKFKYNSHMADIFLYIAIIVWGASLYSLIFNKGKRYYVEGDVTNGDVVIDVKVHDPKSGRKNNQKRLRG